TALAHAHVPSAMKTQISGSAAALPLVADRPPLTAPPGSHATDQFHSTPFAQAIVSCGIRDRRHPTTPTDRAGTRNRRLRAAPRPKTQALRWSGRLQRCALGAAA